MTTRILKNAIPPFREVSKLGTKASQVYSILWESASMDVRFDSRKTIPWEQRRDCGGTTYWTIKGIANEIGSQRKTVSNAICLLLDAGFITVEHYVKSRQGSQHTVFRVTHPNQLEHVRHAIAIIGPPSVRWRKMMTSRKQGDAYKGEIYDTTEKSPTDNSLWTDYSSTSGYDNYWENLDMRVEQAVTEDLEETNNN